MKISLILIFICGIIASSCCSTANCSSDPLAFSLGFIDGNDDHYFDTPNDVEIKIFYEDSTFVNVTKQDFPDQDITIITFFWDVDISVNQYTILANDTLLGNLILDYGIKETTCCGQSTAIIDYEFESEKQYIKDYGLLIVL